MSSDLKTRRDPGTRPADGRGARAATGTGTRPGQGPQAGQVRQPDARRPIRPGRRPRPGWPAQQPKSPVRPASPVRPPGPGRSGRPVRTSSEQPQVRPTIRPRTVDAQSSARDRLAPAAAPAIQVRRASFVLLLLGLLGGGLVCLLVVNTTLAANSIAITNLQAQNAASAQQVQQLQQQVAAAHSAGTIENEALGLGMRPESELVFVNLRTKSTQIVPGTVGPVLTAPGPRSTGANHRAKGSRTSQRSASHKSTRNKRAAGGQGQ
jgi:hypothetical protein